jgi:Cof subfamily protein (haloacid dehalogenase superfamily)
MNKLGIHTIVTDLDGTLLNSESCISELNLKVIRIAIMEGIQFIIATGRRYYSTIPYAKEFNTPIKLICNNGQILRLAPDGERIRSHYLSESIVKKILSFAMTKKLFPILHIDEYENGIDLLSEYPKESQTISKYTSGKVDRALFTKDCMLESLDKITVICFFLPSKDALHEFANELELTLNDSRFRCIVSTIPNVGPTLEILRQDVSKWTGVNEYIMQSGLDPSGVIAFGDEVNDLEMISNSGYGVAMKNSVESLKNAARIVNPYTNNEDGVARILLELGIVHDF